MERVAQHGKKMKDEIERLKMTKKKQRRLEKALAASAAIRLELEKKKQKKREEQQRLDEESNDSCRLGTLDHSYDLDLFHGMDSLERSSGHIAAEAISSLRIADASSWTKKKQSKDEIKPVKMTKKKQRRLEKALAASAAIRMELEKKKQKKREEQQRLDEEGAAIAEAVALYVLLGEEESNDSCHLDTLDHSYGNENYGVYERGDDGDVVGWNPWYQGFFFGHGWNP